MPTVHRAHGLRFVIFTNDHEPAHVHAIRGDGEAKIDLRAGGEPPRLIWVRGLSNAEVRRAMVEITRERDRLLDAWMRIHGRVDP
jgi:hypothetical protein